VVQRTKQTDRQVTYMNYFSCGSYYVQRSHKLLETDGPESVVGRKTYSQATGDMRGSLSDVSCLLRSYSVSVKKYLVAFLRYLVPQIQGQ
jgi:hypothetical protein